MLSSLGARTWNHYPKLAVKFDLLEDALTSRMLKLLFFVPAFLMLSVSSMSQISSQSECQLRATEIAAAKALSPFPLDAGHPSPQWARATAISFCSDWQGKNAAPERQTTVRALWSQETLYLRFECRYEHLTVFTDSAPDGRRDHLWDRDVAETFLQPDPSNEHFYKEFEVSPNGMWIDLDIGSGQLVDLKSGLQRSVVVDEKEQRWFAELAIPMKALTAKFDPNVTWRVNFFRVEGVAEPRFYSAWQPTDTEQPNFHVPQAFGRMRFAP